MARADDVMREEVDGVDTNVSDSITQNEAAVYDRQIRLWGIEAQNKLRHSHVLIVGMKGLGAEIAKNLVLCGLNSMQLVDPEPTTEDDLLSNFFLSRESIGLPRGSASLAGVQELNPLVKLTCLSSLKEIDYSSFSLVIFTDQPYNVVEEADEKCRSLGIRFISASVYGWIGYSFFDFNQHTFRVAKEKPIIYAELDGATEVEKEESDTIVEDEEDKYENKKLEYSSFHDTMNVEWQTKKLIRKAKGLLPSAYFPIRAILRSESNNRLCGDETKDIETLTELWRNELENANQSEDGQTILPDQFDYLLGPQLSATCAVLGGFVGQESIKALTEGKLPLRNLLIYSALDTTARVCHFPPK